MTRWVNFRENPLHEHELQLSDCNIKKYFDPNIMDFWYYLHFFNLTLKIRKQKLKIYIFIPEICTFWEKIFQNIVVG